MFHMMNEARIGVGLSAAVLAYAGYRYALEYAKTRRQGRAPDAKDPTLPMIPIIEHADVRHMLLRQKCLAEGGLGLAFECAALCDRLALSTGAEHADLDLLLDLLTPIAKAWPSAFCLQSNDLAIQVLGGYGYTRDYPVEQYYRDNRLNPIHEGTNGIQGLDLLGRKVLAGNGRGLQLLAESIRRTATEAEHHEALRPLAVAMREAVDRVRTVTGTLLGRGATDPRGMLADSSHYLTLFGHTVVAWIWLRQALAAARALAAGAGARTPYYRGKIDACRYFFRWELPTTVPIASALQQPDAIVLELDTESLCP
jgi:butyryl-CoA dehydrogenase